MQLNVPEVRVPSYVALVTEKLVLVDAVAQLVVVPFAYVKR